MIQYLNDVSQVWWQWMGNMFWQVSLLIILVTVLDMLIRKWAWPQVRHALWALVFIKLVISPAWQMPTSIVLWIGPQVEDQISFNVEMSNPEKGEANFIIPDKIVPPVIVEQASWKSFALLTWISGMIVFALMLLRKIIQFRKIHQRDEKTLIPEWFNELMIKTATCLKLKTIPYIIFSKDAKSPAVYGVFRPVLLLPDGYLDKLSGEQAEHVLIHELCHLKRGDLLVHWFCIIVQIVYWFNPLLIWTRRQMRYVCEICCDLSVANILREKTVFYRETLLHSARELFAENMQPSLGFFGIFEEPFRLVPRLKWLEKKTWENRKLKLSVTICTILLMVACVMPMAGISQTTEYGSSEISPLADKASKNQTLEQIDLNIADLNKKIDKTNKQLKEYMEFVENSPTEDMEILRLNKEYKNLKDKYDLLLRKKLDAEISLSMLKKQNQEASKKEEMEKLSETSTSLNDELESIRKLLQDKEEELKKYENGLSDENQSIRKLSSLVKDFKSMKDLYNSMLDKNSEADIAVSMEMGKDNSRARRTSVFLENELGSIEKRLVEKETELNAFKELNGNSIPVNIKESLIKIEKLQKFIDQLNVYLRENKTNRSNLLKATNMDSNATNDADEVREQSPLSSPLKSSVKEKIVASEEVEKLKKSSEEKAPKKQNKGNPIYLDFENADVTHILKLINKVSGKNIIWDPSIKGRKVSMLLEGLPWEEALDFVLKETGLERKNVVDNIIWVTTKEKMRQIITSKDIKAQTKNNKTHLNMTFPDTEITKILMMISEAAEVNMTWDPAIKGKKVSMTFKDVPWDEALDLVLKEAGLERKYIADNIIWITTSEKLKSQETNKKGLDNGEGKKVLQNSSDESRKIGIDFDNVDIKLFIKFISDITGKNFIVDEDVKCKVTVMAPTKLSVEETYKLFESVLEINGYAAIPSGSAIKIVKANQDI